MKSEAVGPRVRLSLIVALARNRVIGRAGELPWRLSADLRRFKQLTLGHTIIMGRRTFESIGRVLPGRISIVLTRRADFHPDGVLVAASLDEALLRVGNDQEAFVVGGAEVYAAALPHVDRMYITAVQVVVAGDTLFPEYEESSWRLVEETFHPADDRNDYPARFLVYDRRENC